MTTTTLLAEDGTLSGATCQPVPGLDRMAIAARPSADTDPETAGERIIGYIQIQTVSVGNPLFDDGLDPDRQRLAIIALPAEEAVEFFADCLTMAAEEAERVREARQ